MDFIVTISRKSLAVVGSSGKMGQKIAELVTKSPWSEKFQLTHPVDISTKDITGRPDVCIDFSVPASTLQWTKKWGELQTPVLICTTGFKKEEFDELKASLKNNAWALIPNTSLGVYAFIKALRGFVKFFGDIKGIEIHEVHHIHKKDSPSGTALLLQAAMKDAGYTGDIKIKAQREGEVVGLHTVVIQRNSDRLILTHEAQDRGLFAEGALLLAEKLAAKPPRSTPYNFDELLS